MVPGLGDLGLYLRAQPRKVRPGRQSAAELSASTDSSWRVEVQVTVVDRETVSHLLSPASSAGTLVCTVNQLCNWCSWSQLRAELRFCNRIRSAAVIVVEVLIVIVVGVCWSLSHCLLEPVSLSAHRQRQVEKKSVYKRVL